MASSGNYCTFPHSEACAACGNGVPRNGPHSHPVRPDGHVEVVCKDCHHLILLASKAVFESLAAVGIERVPPDQFRAWLDNGLVAVLVQATLSI